MAVCVKFRFNFMFPFDGLWWYSSYGSAIDVCASSWPPQQFASQCLLCLWVVVCAVVCLEINSSVLFSFARNIPYFGSNCYIVDVSCCIQSALCWIWSGFIISAKCWSAWTSRTHGNNCTGAKFANLFVIQKSCKFNDIPSHCVSGCPYIFVFRFYVCNRERTPSFHWWFVVHVSGMTV